MLVKDLNLPENCVLVRSCVERKRPPKRNTRLQGEDGLKSSVMKNSCSRPKPVWQAESFFPPEPQNKFIYPLIESVERSLDVGII